MRSSTSIRNPTTALLAAALVAVVSVSPLTAQANDPIAPPPGDPAAGAADAQQPDPTAYADSLAGAAVRGDPEAQHAYAQLYERGEEGIPRDYDMAAEWYSRAGEQGHLPSMLSISTLYFSSDPMEAWRWVVRAAQMGSAEAQWRAGQALSGRILLRGVQPSRSEAIRWYQQGAAQGHTPSQEALADLYTSMEETSLYDEAAELYERAAVDGESAWGALRLGMMYAVGEGVEENDAAAWDWFSGLGSDYELNPDRYSDEDLEVLGGLQSYYGLDFLGGRGEVDMEMAADAFARALEPGANMIHPSFQRTARIMLEKIPN